ncbi:MAG: aminopeptidase, partial [Clostridia bacterium]|nr:aminopeptidase [Clostridia bacterium]
KRKNFYAERKDELSDVMRYAESYKMFLAAAKTERQAVIETVKLAKGKGFKEFNFGDTIKPGGKLIYNNKNKCTALIRMGTEDIGENGVKMLAAHIDSPRLDLKQVPLYEDAEIAYLKTHYYGGIKKYQWLTVPLALYGVVVLANGEKITVDIGEKDSDPVFYISDLLPHVSQENDAKPVNKAFSAENLNVICGAMPFDDREKDAVKATVLDILNKEYGVCEEDFLSAELELVPALKPRDVGLDRAYIAAYGHDDKVCSYPEITALFDSDGKSTVIVYLLDKEEIGSDGATGAQSRFVFDILEYVIKSCGKDSAAVRAKSCCLSADVTSAYDPAFKDAFESNNTAYLSHGVAMSKYTGARGKYDSNDASAEYVGYVRKLFNDAGVIWQTGEIGKVDLGGGGTVAKYFSKLNIDTVDVGVPVMSMHAPYELVSKADVYAAYKAFLAFIK